MGSGDQHKGEAHGSKCQKVPFDFPKKAAKAATAKPYVPLNKCQKDAGTKRKR